VCLFGAEISDWHPHVPHFLGVPVGP
jgi:hypothetical protein